MNESEEMKEFLRAEFAGECSEVGMYLAMSRAAIRQGYPEVGAFYRQAAFEEADHASRSAHAQARPLLRRSAKRWALTLFTTASMRWPVTRQDTDRASRAFWTDTSANNKISH